MQLCEDRLAGLQTANSKQQTEQLSERPVKLRENGWTETVARTIRLSAPLRSPLNSSSGSGEAVDGADARTCYHIEWWTAFFVDVRPTAERPVGRRNWDDVCNESLLKNAESVTGGPPPQPRFETQFMSIWSTATIGSPTALVSWHVCDNGGRVR